MIPDSVVWIGARHRGTIDERTAPSELPHLAIALIECIRFGKQQRDVCSTKHLCIRGVAASFMLT
jgi:hypothetical protein